MSDFVSVHIGSSRFYLSSDWADAVLRLCRLASEEDERILVPVKLEFVNPNKVIHTIKEVRAVTGLFLREAKDLIDRVRDGAPQELGIFSFDKAMVIRDLFADFGSVASVPSAIELLAEQSE